MLGINFALLCRLIPRHLGQMGLIILLSLSASLGFAASRSEAEAKRSNEIEQAVSELYSAGMSLSEILKSIKTIDQELQQLNEQENKHKEKLSQLVKAEQRADIDPSFVQRLLSDNPQQADLARLSFDYIRREVMADIDALKKASAELQKRRDYLNKLRQEQESSKNSRQKIKTDQEKRVQTVFENDKKAQSVPNYTGQGLKSGGVMPVQGKVLSSFTRNGAGVEIETQAGGSIKAIAAGRVMAVTKEMIVIDHGEDYVSSYSLSGGKAIVAVNQVVVKGAEIAKSGGSVFFGVLFDGQAVDPLAFVK